MRDDSNATPGNPDYSQRDPDPGVSEQFFQRWSPRSFKKVTIPQPIISSVVDAARWSPSCFNAQPWKFITSTEDSFDLFLEHLVEGNQVWAKNASTIGFVAARKHFEHNGKPNNYAQFDAGAAWMSLTLQANIVGLHTHGMGGIHHAKVYETFDIDPNEYEVICGFVIGVMDTPDQLPEKMANSEVPTARKQLHEIWQQGKPTKI